MLWPQPPFFLLLSSIKRDHEKSKFKPSASAKMDTSAQPARVGCARTGVAPISPVSETKNQPMNIHRLIRLVSRKHKSDFIRRSGPQLQYLSNAAVKSAAISSAERFSI
jgi:hypothetical protein